MPTPVPMPRLGMTMEEGRVLAWQVSIGARVERGAVLLTIETEKAEAEIEATSAGWLRCTFVEADNTVPCGTLLGALTDTPDEPFDADAFRSAHDRPEAPPSAPATTTAPAAPRVDVAAPPRATAPVAPAARARARELGIDVGQVRGSGPGGRVTRQDVDAFAEAHRWLIDVGGLKLDVPRAGQGDPVWLLPGFGVDASVFARQIEVLAAGRCVFGINPRGVGLSDAPADEAYDVAQTAHDAAALPGAAAHVIGASLGAAAALELTLCHPERVRSLVLITPFVTASPRLLAVVDAWTELAATAPAPALARALLPWLFSDRLLGDTRARERSARGLAASLSRVPAATLARSAAGLRAWSGTRGADLGKVAVPVLVIAGAADLLTPDAASVAAAIPGARLLVVPQAGHALAIEAADVINPAIRSHLESA